MEYQKYGLRYHMEDEDLKKIERLMFAYMLLIVITIGVFNAIVALVGNMNTELIINSVENKIEERCP